MNLDRSKTIGASDTYIVMGGWGTKQFRNWWGRKITPELFENDTPFSSKYTETGTLLEEHIIKKLSEIEGVEIKKADPIEKGFLVVNLDGISRDTIYEVKCTKYVNWLQNKLDNKYRMQVIVQMYASGFRNGYVCQYGVLESEHNMETRLDPKIDEYRLRKIKIRYDEEFIDEYLRRVEVLEDCFNRKVYPDEV